jgi:hypothetical protein
MCASAKLQHDHEVELRAQAAAAAYSSASSAAASTGDALSRLRALATGGHDRNVVEAACAS